MGADEKRSTGSLGKRCPRWKRAESRLRTRLSFRSSRAIARRHVQCCAVLYIALVYGQSIHFSSRVR